MLMSLPVAMSQAPTETPARRGCSGSSEAERSQRAPLRHDVPGELQRDTAWQRAESCVQHVLLRVRVSFFCFELSLGRLRRLGAPPQKEF